MRTTKEWRGKRKGGGGSKIRVVRLEREEGARIRVRV